MLSVDGLTKRFGGFTALNAVSFEVREGEILGLIGPNGSGKTTCFNCVAGALLPTAGSIKLAGAEIGGLTPDAVCHLGVARTFQIPRPFRKLSILENVAVAAHFGASERTGEADARRRAAEILTLVGLPASTDASTTLLGAGGLKKLELARALATRPKLLLADESLGGLDPTEMGAAAEILTLVGLPTSVDASPTLLGAGGLKKLELARALATRPKLLLADESLGGLDPAEMSAAADMLRRVRGELGVTIVWVEHIMATLMRVVDRVVVLDHGEKIAEGRPLEIAENPQVIEAYLGEKVVLE